MDFLRGLLLFSAVWLAGCAGCAAGSVPGTSSSSSSSSSSGSGTGGSDVGPCGLDCSKLPTPACSAAVCNTGQVEGPLNTCIVVPAADGTSCEDGKFCTVQDVCMNGVCVGGGQNDCGTTPPPCMASICYEATQTCSVTPVDDGTACTSLNLCELNGICNQGNCQGVPKDCSFSPLSECNTVACEPTTGKCVGTADPTKDDTPCLLSGDVCSIDRTCLSGLCQGGTPKDCSALDVGCQVGACDSTTGICQSTPAPLGAACTNGIADCYLGACDAKGACGPSSAMPDGTACNDHDSCTKGDTCTGGTCAGGAVAGCVLYFHEGFEVCPDGWTFGGDWQCGTPTNVGPPSCHTGHGCIATQLAGDYSINQSFDTTVADSPPISLVGAQSPHLSFWVWDYTEGGTFDGWNFKVSTDGGNTFTEVTTVTPPYDLTIVTQPAWGGDYSALGWQNYTADLTAYAGQTINLRFAFRSDGATVFPGVYIDDIVVAEPTEIPLYISTTSPLPDVYENQFYATTITATGGSGSPEWSLDTSAGVNAGWLSIAPVAGNPTTAILSGTPLSGNLGPVRVVVHVDEMTLPSNFAESTFTFNVNPDFYYTSFEGACPDGWTLTGDWQCGVPANPLGPAAAYVGTQCLATQLANNYHDGDTWAGNTATSPPIDLTTAVNPKLSFRMWIDTEGSTYDGANLQISANGGATYTVLPNTVPQFPLTVGNEPAWGGHQAALGWQLVTVDLSTYGGQTILLRFDFQSDTSGNYAGVYIDDILIN